VRGGGHPVTCTVRYGFWKATKPVACDPPGALENAVCMKSEDFLKLAESYTASGADREIEKYSQKQVSLEQTRKQK